MVITQKIFLLGGFRTEPALNIPGGHPYRLFVYLLLHPKQAHGRDQIIERLWPEFSPARARRALSDALYRLRQAIPESWLIVQSDTLSLVSEPFLWVDAWELAAHADSQDMALLKEVAALYLGELTPDIDDEWVWIHRERLRTKVIVALHQLAANAEDGRDYLLAESYFRRLAELDDMNELTRRGLMRCLAAQDRLDEALAVYQQFQAFLADELSVPPTEETRRLAQQLQDEWEVRQQSVGERKTLPFVGRMTERAQLLTLLDKARSGEGGLVVVLGQAGIGKSRLLEFLGQSADWRGWQVAWGRGEEFVLPRPYAPFVAALTAVLPKPRIQQLTRFLPGWWMALLARILPAFEQQPGLPTVPETAVNTTQLTTALRALLSGLQQIAPQLIILDDVQWADPEIWPLLDGLQESLTEMSILLIVCGRDDALQTQVPAWEAIQKWGNGGLPIIRLGGLAPQPLAEMARALGKPALTSRKLAALHQMSAGNPLLALSLLEADEPVTAVAESSQLLEMQRKRLALLSDAALLVLQAAAVLGYRFDYEMWEAVVRAIDTADLPALAGELEQRRLLMLEASGYRFHHDTLRACVYNDCPPARRPILHQRALAAYEQLRPDDTVAMLYHAGAAENDTAVAKYALRAGQEALEKFAYKDALSYFSQSLEVLPANHWRDRFTALVGRATTYHMQADQERLRVDLEALQEVVDHLPDLALKADVLLRRASLAWLQGEQDEAREIAEEGLELTQATGDLAQEAAFMETLGRVARNQGDFHLARDWVTQAKERFTAVGDQFGEASTLDKLANVAYEMGEFEKALALHQQSIAIFHNLGATPYESRSLSGQALVLKSMGEFEKSRQTHLQVLKIAREFGDKHSEWVQLVLLGNVAFELGNYATAVTWYTDALSLSGQINNPRYISMTLNNLGEAYRENGEPEPALMYYREAARLNDEKGFKRGEGHSLNGMGFACLDLQQTHEAQEAFASAKEIWEALNERHKLIETLSGLALMHVTDDDLPAAMVTIQTALQQLDNKSDHPLWRRLTHYVAYCVWLAQGDQETAVYHLCLAAQAVSEITGKLPATEQAAFRDRVPLNRKIDTALWQYAEKEKVSLVSVDVPLGQKLEKSDYVSVTWTTSLPTDQLLKNSAERRQHILQRLLHEAETQGASPTDEDLATAVGVSRRTVLRDIKALNEKGVVLPTRRRSV